MNLVSLAMNFITPAIVSRIASALGIDSKIAQMAISAALPSILAGISGKAAKPDGLSMLTGLLGKTDSGLLSNLGSMIGGSDQSKLVTGGTNVLTQMLGNSALGSLSGAVGKFAGMGEGPTKSLLGMLAPVAMGTLAQQQKAGGLDAAGLAKMLSGQGENIAKALPAGFGDLLKGSGLLDSLPKPGVTMSGASTDAVKDMARSAGATVSSVTSAASKTASAASDSVRHATAATPSGLPSWLTWGALLAALLLGWYMFGPSGGQRVAAPPARVVHNNIDLVPQVNTMYNGLRDVLATVKDQNSAQAALPKLQDGAKLLEGLVTQSNSMAPGTRSDLAALIANYLPELRKLIAQVLGNSAVASVAKPVLDMILGRMETLAKK
jgi:hypothetical protein